MALVLMGIVSEWWMRPLMDLSFEFLKLVLSPLEFLVK
jgi:hypothetical protein